MQSIKWVTQIAIVVLGVSMAVNALAIEWEAQNHQAMAGDIDADGRQDILLQAKAQNTQAEVAYDITLNLELMSALQNTVLYKGASNYSLTYGEEPNQSLSPAPHNRLFGDFNGDGLQDLYLQAPSPEKSLIVLGFLPGQQPQIYQEIAASENGVNLAKAQATLSISDVNGDGRSDVRVSNSAGQFVLLSQSDGITSAVNYPLCQSDGLRDSDCDDSADRYDEQPFNSANSTSIDETLAPSTVGAIDGKFDVSPDGKFSYSIPLEAIPAAGEGPELSLVYSQSAGNDIVGVGWHISGLSEIKRCATTLVQDGYINGVNFNASDRYCLNGERLIAIGNGEYRTETETFTKIISYGSIGNGPEYFVAWHANGSVETYGGTANSRRLPTSTSPAGVHTWAVSRIEDRQTNYATYEYTNNSAEGEFWITAIHYGGNADANQVANRHIHFDYESVSRSDQPIQYQEGVKTHISKRLEYIRTKLGDSTVREYRMQYTTGKTGRSLLESVEECLPQQSACLPKTVITWDKGLSEERALNLVNTAETSGYSASVYQNQQHLSGDVNGDGRADLIWVYHQNNTLTRVVFLANANGVGFAEQAKQTDTGYYPAAVDSPDQHYLVADVNGDGKSDLVWIARKNDTVVRTVYLANGAGTGFVSQGYEIDSRPQYSEVSRGKYLTGDVNGDGLQDVVWAYHHQNKLGITTYLSFYNDGNVYLGKTSETIDTQYSPDFYNSANFLLGDTNGDGKDDFIWTFRFQNYMYRALFLANANGSGFQKVSLGRSSVTTDEDNHQMRLGDINGDRKADLVWSSHSAGKLNLRVYRASRLGTSFSSSFSSIGIIPTIGHTQQKVQLTDLDNDGLSDVVYTYVYGTNFKWQSFRTVPDATGFAMDFSGSTAIDSGTSLHEYRFADMSGDGKADMLHTYNTSAGQLKRYTYTQAQSYPDHVELITDGLNNTIDPSYEYLASSAIYTKGSGTVYPLRNDTGLAYAVRQLQTSNGIGGINTVRYHYKGARTHLRGRGFVGFEQRTVEDISKGVSVVETYHQAFPFIGRLKKAVSSHAEVSFQEVHNDWQKTPINTDKTVYPYLHRQATVKRKLADGSEYHATVTTNTYDPTYGYLDTVELKTGRGYSSYSLSTVDQTVVTDYDYNINASDWRIRFVSREEKTFSAPGEAARTALHTYTPYNDSSLLSRTETEYKGSAVERTKSFVRDDYGNIISATVTGNDIDGGSLLAQVDTVNRYLDGVYPEISTNAEQHAEQRVFNPRFGSLLRSIDANGRVTDNIVDGFGNPLRERMPDGTEITYQYQLCHNCPYDNAVYKVFRTTTHPNAESHGAPEVVSYYDPKRRLIAEETRQPNNNWVVVKIEYDAFGRLKRQSQPHFSGQTVHWTTYAYNAVDLPTLELRPDGGKTETFYLGDLEYGSHTRIKNTVKIPGQSDQILESHLYQNSLSQLRESVDAASTETRYWYDAPGNLRQVKVNNNDLTLVTIGNDVAGNRTLLVDPDAGRIQYEYDGAFRERRRTYGAGAGAHTVTTSYDRLGRKTQRVDRDGTRVDTASWTYDPPNGVGLLHTATAADYYEELHYDGLARINQRDIKLLGESQGKTFQYTYDGYSRPDVVQYPSGIAVRNVYSSEGYKNRVRNAKNDKDYWVAGQWDAFGNVTQESFGNGVTTVSDYTDQMGRIENRITSNLQSTGYYQNLNYRHDSAGNLRRRESLRNGQENLVETFQFDSLHRLYSATTSGLTSGVRTVNYRYDALGNIKTKSDASDTNGYGYGGNGGGVHAVSSVTKSGSTTQYHYDFKGNMIRRGAQTLDYSVFNKPVLISESTNQTQFRYGPDRQRFYQRNLHNNQVTETRYYGKGFEVVSKADWQREKTYIDDFLVITRVTSLNGATKGEDLDYLHRDHLGSVEATSDRFGKFTGRFAFDPWGQRRKDSWENADATFLAGMPERTFESTARGFTGHEHLDTLGIIHMNGRVYDPLIGRFLSPDDFVQSPENSQNYNRYSYVLNNPISYTDPSGEFIPLVIGAVWAAVKVYDVATTAYDAYHTVTDKNTTTGQKAQSLGIQLAMAAVPVPKVITKTGGKIVSKVVTPKAISKAPSAKQAKNGTGSDTNTSKKAKSDAPCGCFAPGTLVLTEDGLRPIETIQMGDRVAAMSEFTHDISWKAIENIYHYQGREYFTLSLLETDDTVTELTVTDDHPMWVVGEGWVRSIDLELGDQLRDINGDILEVVGWQSQNVYGETYNFEVEDYHSYFVGEEGVWVHNGGPCDYDAGGKNQAGEVTKKVDTPHTQVTGGNKTAGAPKTNQPNSIHEQTRPDRSKSVTYYDEKGRMFSREDYGQQRTHGQLGRGADGRSVPHEHGVDWSDQGPIGKKYRELNSSGKPVGPWINE